MNDHSAERSTRPASEPGGEGYRSGSLGSAFFDMLSIEDRAALIERCTTRVLARRQTLFSEGDKRSQVFVVRGGRVKLSRRSASGAEVIVALCGAGELVGYSGLSRCTTRLLTAQVLESGEAYAMDETEFRMFLSNRPAAAIAVIETMRHRMEAVTDALADVVSEDVPSRLVRLLRRLAQRQGSHRNGQWTMELRLTHQELANMVGARRQTVTTAINDLHRTGVLARDAHRIVLSEPKGVRKQPALARS